MKINYIFLFVALFLTKHSYSMQKSNDASSSSHIRSFHGAGVFRAVLGLSAGIYNGVSKYLQHNDDSIDTNLTPTNSEEFTVISADIEPSVSHLQGTIEKSYLSLLPVKVLKFNFFPLFNNRDLDNIFINLDDVKTTADSYRTEEIHPFLFLPKEIQFIIIKELDPDDINKLRLLSRDFYCCFKRSKIFFNTFNFFEDFMTDLKNANIFRNIISSKIKCYHQFNHSFKKLSVPAFVFLTDTNFHEKESKKDLLGKTYESENDNNILNSLSYLKELNKLKIRFKYGETGRPSKELFINIIEVSKKIPPLKEVIFNFSGFFGDLETLNNYLNSLDTQKTKARTIIYDKIDYFTKRDLIVRTNRFLSDLLFHKFSSIKKIRLNIHGYNSEFFKIISQAAMNKIFYNTISLNFEFFNFSKVPYLEYDYSEYEILDDMEIFFEAISLGKLKKLKDLKINIIAHEYTFLSDKTFIKLGDALNNGSLIHLENLSVIYFQMARCSDGKFCEDNVKMSSLFDLLSPRIISAILDEKVPNLTNDSIFRSLQADRNLSKVVSLFGKVANEKLKYRKDNIRLMINNGEVPNSEIKKLEKKVFDGFLNFIGILEYMIRNQKNFNEQNYIDILQELSILRNKMSEIEDMEIAVHSLIGAINAINQRN